MSDLTEFLLARIAEDEELMREDFLPLHPWFAARILGGCEARRRIMHQVANAEMAASQHDSTEADCAVNDALFGTLLLLALPYADHPDYLPEWKP